MKNNKIIGIIGGLVLGYIFAIPWILAALYVNIFVAYLAVPIGIGVYYGYKLFSKLDDDTPLIITATSLFIIISITVVIIPGIKLNSVGIPITIENIISLYNINGLIINLLLAIFIGYLGISNSTAKVYKDLETNNKVTLNKNFEITENNGSELINYEYPAYENLKDFFVDRNATCKENAISKKELKDYQTSIDKIFEIIDLRNKRVIKKYKGKYYFDLKMTISDIKKATKLHIIKIIFYTTIIFILFLTIILIFGIDI